MVPGVRKCTTVIISPDYASTCARVAVGVFDCAKGQMPRIFLVTCLCACRHMRRDESAIDHMCLFNITSLLVPHVPRRTMRALYPLLESTNLDLEHREWML